MAGKSILTSIVSLLLLVLSVLPVGAQDKRSIAVLLSNSEEVYSETAAAFEREAGYPVHIFNLYGDIKNNPGLKEELLASEPGLIFALGAKAAYMAKLWTADRPDIKVIFSMVLNWQKYGLLDGQDNIAGIAAEIAPGTQFVNLTTFVPSVKKIGVIYSVKNSGDIIAQAQKKAKLLGLELVAIPIERTEDFQGSYKKVRGKVDAFWVLNDPVTYSLENMAWIAAKCVKDRLVCLGQSKNITEQGLSFSVNTDPMDVGSQAASLARNILNGNQTVKEIGVMPPLGTNILVNLKTTNSIGIEINKAALNMATTIFDE